MDHAVTLQRVYDAINEQDMDVFAEILADDFVEHEETPGLEPDKQGVIAFFRMWTAAFPDLRMDPEDILASGDKAVARLRVTGTHRGVFMGIPATDRSIDVGAIDIMRFGDDGLVHEHWGVFDALKMMEQLGIAGGGPSA